MKVLGTVPGPKLSISAPPTPWSQVLGPRPLVPGPGPLISSLWSQVLGPWCVVVGLWSGAAKGQQSQHFSILVLKMSQGSRRADQQFSILALCWSAGPCLLSSCYYNNTKKPGQQSSRPAFFNLGLRWSAGPCLLSSCNYNNTKKPGQQTGKGLDEGGRRFCARSVARFGWGCNEQLS